MMGQQAFCRRLHSNTRPFGLIPNIITHIFFGSDGTVRKIRVDVFLFLNYDNSNFLQQQIIFFGSDKSIFLFNYDNINFLQQQIISLFGPIRWYTEQEREVFICPKPI